MNFKKIIILLLTVFLFSIKISVKPSYKSGTLIKIPIILKKNEVIEDIEKITINNEKISIIRDVKDHYFILYAVDVQFYKKTYLLKLYLKNGIKIIKKFSITDGAFSKEGFVYLNEKKIKLKLNRLDAIKESNFFHKIYLKKRKMMVLKSDWILPVGKKFYKTSEFGKKRKYFMSKKSKKVHSITHHKGADFIPAKGKNIYSSQDGIVIYSGEKKIRGNIIVIYHGANIYTSYSHLSKRLVFKNKKIKKGELIGLMGSTGLSSAPHLHWEGRIKNIIFDPEDLLEL